MTYLIASAQRNDLQSVRESSPEIWRQVRRYNQPVQLALAAADEVMQFSEDPSTAALISLAPCQPGSADLYRWGHMVTAGMAAGTLGNLRMNPTQTLHAVDNLALSALAISHGNHSYCLGLGVALLVSLRTKPYQPLRRIVRLLSISRTRARTSDVVPHAANGLAAFLSAVVQGRMSYVVPPEHTDGLSGVTVSLEIVQ